MRDLSRQGWLRSFGRSLLPKILRAVSEAKFLQLLCSQAAIEQTFRRSRTDQLRPIGFGSAGSRLPRVMRTFARALMSQLRNFATSPAADVSF